MRTLVRAVRERDRVFEVTTSSQARFRVEAGAYDRPGEAAGASPMELLLAALVTCAGSTLEAVLERMRFDLVALNVVADAERAVTVPRVYTAITLDFHVASPVPTERLTHAIDVTERTCSVSAMLSEVVPIAPRLIHVHQVEPALTLPLRQHILRPHQTLEEIADTGEDRPGTAWFAAVRGEEVVGTVGLIPEPSPDRPDALRPVRLRGMATSEDVRGHGLGRVLLAAAVRHVRAHDADLLWCSARTPAEGFYRTAGFEVTSGVYEVEDIGPHVRMAVTP
jgi:uncharacterized OsmC-like protein/GNAT superfamily N-acetyltransferase